LARFVPSEAKAHNRDKGQVKLKPLFNEAHDEKPEPWKARAQLFIIANESFSCSLRKAGSSSFEKGQYLSSLIVFCFILISIQN
jgi:hypothetical protein